MDYLTKFRMPTPMKITGRSSSITNAFINSIIPVRHPTGSEVKYALEILEQDPGDVRCVYCGDTSTEWDHLHPLVIDKKPTGYISEIQNLVPSCGKCNQSKGNKEWKIWMTSNARLSPKSRGISDIDDKIKRLEAYEGTFTPTRINIRELVGEELWRIHWENWEGIINLMEHAQSHAERVKQHLSLSTQKP